MKQTQYIIKNSENKITEKTERTEYVLKMDDFVTSISKRDSNDKLLESSAYFYDQFNVLKEIQVKNSEGNIKSTTQFTANTNNQIVRMKIDGLDRKSDIRLSYDGLSDQPSSGEEKDENENLERRWKIKYINGNVSLFTLFNAYGEILSETSYTYNDNNDIANVRITHKSNIITQQFFEYKYDNKGNWKERKVYDENTTLISSSKRELFYWN